MIYERLGVRTIVNAKGTATRLSGGIMRPEVAEAMVQASQACVDMAELQAKASEIIAGHTGAEAGLVTSGAAAGLLLGTAAAVTGLDPGRMNRLPDTAGMSNEVIVARSQRNLYDHAVRTAGVRLIEVGLPDRYAGAGVRDAEAWEIADAINEQTAAILWVAHPAAKPCLGELAAVAHAAGVPVIVDAAAQLPPASNLRRFIDDGADLVAFSGGKAIGGPQASGFLCGRRDLIMAAALQMLDMDMLFDQWQPPAPFIDKALLKGLPQHGIGRPCKAGKEEIAGLLTALDLFVADDPAARRQRWLGLCQAIVEAAGRLDHATLRLQDQGEVPTVALSLDQDRAGMTAFQLLLALEGGEPSIRVDNGALHQARLSFNPQCLAADAPALIGRRLRELLTA
ncbi:MAG: hypothetical protein R3F54_06055 [Alphaproteobacteria bacterium]